MHDYNDSNYNKNNTWGYPINDIRIEYCIDSDK